MTQSDEPTGLPEMLIEWIRISIDEQGIHPLPMLVRSALIGIEFYALDLPPEGVYAVAMKKARENSTLELIYGMDRSTRPGQGTEFADCFAGAWFIKRMWHPFVINYQHEPRVVRDFDWANTFWNGGIRHELVQHGIDHRLVSAVASKPI